MAVCGSPAPSVRYSAIPSTNHSGTPSGLWYCVGDVELKRVDDLVAEHVIGIRQAGGERQDDAAFAGVGEAAGALVDEAAVNVGLFEAAVRAVEHDRLPAAECVLERRAQAGVPAFGHARRERRGGRIFL